MKDILAKYRIDTIWHFTDKSNLESIEEHEGILSQQELEDRGVDIQFHGGNEWSREADRLKNMHRYVHLTFVKDHPMLYHAKRDGRIPDPIWLAIESSLLFEDGVLFCSDVSNKNNVDFFVAAEAKDRIDFEVLFTRTNWKDPEVNARRQAAVKSEILVPDCVPIAKIKSYANG